MLNIETHPAERIAAIDSDGTVLKYGELNDFTREIEKLIPGRSIVFILTKNSVGAIAWSIGSINAGVVPLLLDMQIEQSLLNSLFEIYKPQFICMPSDKEPLMDASPVDERFGFRLWKTKNEGYPVFEELSHLLPTSGSTGSPKLVRHCYRNIEASGLNISTFFKITREDRALMVLPIHYTMGLSMVFSHFFAGATVLITGLSMTDRRFWDFIKEERATSFTGVPYSFEILNLMRFFRMDLPHLELLTQGGGKMPQNLNLKFAEYARDKGKRWIATYGQTEGTARMAYLPPEFAISKMGSIGKAVPNAELSLIDDEGNVIDKPNIEGEMCYRGKNVTLGYATSKEDLLLGDEKKGYMRTGDLAYRDEDGFYFIVGRKGRFLKLFGERIGLDECEQIIKTKFSIECACVGTDKKMTIYITKPGLDKDVKEELVHKTKVVASAFEVMVIDEIPRNEAGKILYRKLIMN